ISGRVEVSLIERSAIPAKVRDVEYIEDLDDTLNTITLLKAELLREANVVRMEVVAEIELRGKHQRSSQSIARLGYVGVVVVPRLEKLGAAGPPSEIFDPQTRKSVTAVAIAVDINRPRNEGIEGCPARVYRNQRSLDTPRQIHQSTKGKPISRIARQWHMILEDRIKAFTDGKPVKPREAIRSIERLRIRN